MNPHLAFALSEYHIIILIVIGLLLFGRRLPEIGRSLGKGIVEFKKGLKGMEDEVDAGGGAATTGPTPPRQDAAPRPDPAIEAPRPPQRVTASTPKFEEPAVPKFDDAAPKFEEKPASAPPPPS